ncbi:MAG TPA: RsmD family RNA methyltransferase [Polyangiaceae bacterium]|jgi:23S rRNA (uracil1939-C5)-methyltransferase|nr:RsmD family RNA methyltransferase [Polyangiaceae bacterium]
MMRPETFDCPHGERCGGCFFLGVPYAQQLVEKQGLVRRAFDRYSEHAALAVDAVAGASPNTAYRVRAKLVCDQTGAVGLFARDSHDVVDVPECRVLAPELSRVAAAARKLLSNAAMSLDGLDLRLVDRGVLVTLIAPRGTPIADLSAFSAALSEASSEVIGVAASFRDARSAALLGTGHTVLFGNDVEAHHLSSTGPYHLAAHGAFTQVHLGQAERAHRAIEAELRARDARRVLELYAGSAALSLRLAAAGFELSAVEAYEPALSQAKRAAREQNLHLTTISARAEDATTQLAAQQARFDAVIVNPPRRGLSLEVRRALARLAPRAIVYMSCNPATLARDLSHLKALGFAANVISPFDMIPHSDAVECLVVLEYRGASELCVVHQDELVIAVDRASYDEPEQLLARVRELPNGRMAEPVFPLDRDASGLTLFARPSAARSELRAALVSGQSFVALARGITHKKGRIRRPLGPKRRGASACTTYQRKSVHGGHSLLELDPGAASPEEIRRHLAAIGHPILGDARSCDAGSNSFFEHRHGLDRSFLHCSALRIALPTGTIELSSALPGELAGVLASASPETAPLGE